MSSLYSSANLAHFESTAPLKSLLMLRIFSEVSPLWPYVNSRNCSPYNSSVIVSLEVFLDHLYEVLPCTYSDWYSSKNSRGLLCIFLALFFFWLSSTPQFPTTLAFLNCSLCLLYSEIDRLCLDSPSSLYHSPRINSRTKAGVMIALTLFVFLFSQITSLYCILSSVWKCVLIFCQFSSCF